MREELEKYTQSAGFKNATEQGRRNMLEMAAESLYPAGQNPGHERLIHQLLEDYTPVEDLALPTGKWVTMSNSDFDLKLKHLWKNKTYYQMKQAARQSLWGNKPKDKALWPERSKDPRRVYMIHRFFEVLAAYRAGQPFPPRSDAYSASATWDDKKMTGPGFQIPKAVQTAHSKTHGMFS